MPMMQNNAMSQYPQHGASQQEQQQMFMVQPSPEMYQAAMQAYQQEAISLEAQADALRKQGGMLPSPHASTTQPQAPPGVFMNQQQEDNTLLQNPTESSNVVVMQQFVYVPFYDPCAMQQFGGPSGSVQFADPWGFPTSASKDLKGKNGGAAARKKPTGALRPDEVQHLKRAVQEKLKLQSKPALLRGSSKYSQCSTAEGLSNDGDNDESSCKTPSEEADLDSAMKCSSFIEMNSPTHLALCVTENVDTALVDLGSVDDCKREAALQWVSESFWSLALNKKGCRVVQKAIDVGSPAYQLQLLDNLQGYVNVVVESPHGNYVLAKFIEIAPPERIQFIVAELQEHVLYVARHRFGCRILQRLLEHCQPWQTQHLINKALADATSLCRHQYGNFILQHILQYGSQSQRSAVADVVLEDIIRLSKHRLASHIVSCALTHCSPEDVRRLTHEVLHDEAQLANLARREYGSFVVREVHRAKARLQASDALQQDSDMPKEIEDGQESDKFNCAQEVERQCTVGFERQCTVGFERQCTVDFDRQCSYMERQCTVDWKKQVTEGYYMD